MVKEEGREFPQNKRFPTCDFQPVTLFSKLDEAANEEMERRQQYQASDSPRHLIYLASAEDIILNMLQWFQMGGGVSERQRNDVLGVIRIQHKKLDRSYLERAAELRGSRIYFKKFSMNPR